MIFKDLKLKVTDHDLETTRFDLFFARESDALKQRLKIRLSTFLGEWFLDRSAGLPYYEEVLKKNPDIRIIQALIREQVLTTPGVQSIQELNVDFDNARRVLNVEITVLAENGEVIEEELQV